MTDLDLPALKKLCSEASALPWHFSAAGFTKDKEGKVVSLDYRQEQIEKNEKFLTEATTALPKLIEEVGRLREERKVLHEDPYARVSALDLLEENAALRRLLGEAALWIDCKCNPERNCNGCQIVKRIDAVLGKKK